MENDSTTELAGGPGLTNTPVSEWPKAPANAATMKPIDMLKPGSDLHASVLSYLNKRLKMSERKMLQFQNRWRIAERRVQAYIDLNDYEKLLKAQNQDGKTPKVISITVPYCFATQATIVTYLVHTFMGRKPMFQVNTYKAEAMDASTKMEMVLQYNADATRLQRHLFQFLNDGELYGVAIMRTQWREERQKRTTWQQQSRIPLLGTLLGKQKVRQERVTYQGNNVCSIDPYLFFPDPRVPMCEVNRRGEFVIWRAFEGKHTLMKEQQAGRFSWVENIPATPSASLTTEGSDGSSSSRSILSGGDPLPGNAPNSSFVTGMSYIQIDQGTFDIIPKELGLGDSTQIERWIFAWGNRGQIIQAEPFDADHGMHPVVVSEPYGLGYGFGQPSLHDYIGDMQDTMSWFVSSHIRNVRTAINNMFVVDPSMIEMQDLKNPDAGKLIRLKQAAYGQDVRQALQQLQTSDVTRGHVNDLQMFMRMGDALSSVTDNIRGLQDSGGRKTATEVRTSGEAAASRLAAHCRLISAQAIVDLTEQMCMNLQQYLSDDFYLEIVGQEGRMAPLRVSPDGIVGDFIYPVNDGTLPLDRVALLDVWQQIMQGVAKDPELRQEFSLPKMFEWAAELAGARNIQMFKNANPQGVPQVNANVVPTAQAAQQAQKGNLVPLGQGHLPQPTIPGPGPGRGLVQ